MEVEVKRAKAWFYRMGVHRGEYPLANSNHEPASVNQFSHRARVHKNITARRPAAATAPLLALGAAGPSQKYYRGGARLDHLPPRLVVGRPASRSPYVARRKMMLHHKTPQRAAAPARCSATEGGHKRGVGDMYSVTTTSRRSSPPSTVVVSCSLGSHMRCGEFTKGQWLIFAG